LRAPFLGAASSAHVLGIADACVLAPPALQRLTLQRLRLEAVATTGMVVALSLARLQTLTDLVLSSCAWEVGGALVAMVHLHTLRRLVVERLKEDSRQRGLGSTLVHVGGRHWAAVEFFEARRPDIVFHEVSPPLWLA